MTVVDYNRAQELISSVKRLNETLAIIKACKIGPDVIFGTSYRSAKIGMVADSGILDAVKTLFTAHLEERIADLEKEFEELGRV